MVENPQDSTSQPIELPSPVNEQHLQTESEGQDNPKSDHEEETGHSGDEQRNKSVPRMCLQGDLLHDLKLAQILANMNDYMQPESPLNPNLGATQSP